MCCMDMCVIYRMKYDKKKIQFRSQTIEFEWFAVHFDSGSGCG